MRLIFPSLASLLGAPQRRPFAARGVRRALACALAALLFLLPQPAPARAQVPRLRFEHLSVEDGLAQSKVNSILQDSQGFMWFGTGEGLNKYDGHTFTVYTYDPDSPASISDNVVYALYEDHTGALWAGTQHGLNRFDRDSQRFTRYRHDPANPASVGGDALAAIVEDGSGDLWVGALSGAVSRFDRAAQTFTSYTFDDPALGADHSAEGGLLYRDRVGDLWVGNTAGLFRFDRARRAFVQVVVDPADPGRDIYAIYADQQDMLWLGTDQGLYRLDRATGQAQRYRHNPSDPHSLSDDWVRAIRQDRSGALWVGTQQGGLNTFDPRAQTFARYSNDPSDPHSLSGNSITALYEDRAGLLWIGTGGGGNGVNMFNPATRAFHHYTADPAQPQGLGTRTIAAVYEDRHGDVWLGGYDADGLSRFDRTTQTVVTYRHRPGDPRSLPSDRIYDVYEDRAGTLWVGTLDAGIAAFDRATQTFTSYRHRPDDPGSLSSDSVPAILEDRSGALWVGTEDGLNRLDRGAGAFRSYRHDPADAASLSHSEISALYEDAAGVLWVGTWGGGLNRFDRATGSFVHYTHRPDQPASLSDDRIYTITGDQQGHLWIGTKIGLNMFSPDTGAFVHYSERDGLPASAIACIQVDRAGLLWLSSGKGMARLDPATGAVRRFSARDGLQSDDFNGGACSQSAAGELFFGGNNGFNAFYPQQIATYAAPPPVALTGIYKLNQPIDLRADPAALTQLSLSYDDKVVAFAFAALDYADPSSIQYAYRLEGFDSAWVQSGAGRLATYTNLDGGSYTFLVKAANADGMWGAPAALRLYVATPPWKTWWAYGLYALLALAVAGVAARSYARERAHRALRFEIAERERAEYEQRRLYKVAEGFREIVAAINSTRSLADVLAFIIDQALRQLGVDAGQICRLQRDADGERLSIEAAQGFASSCIGATLPDAPWFVGYQAIRERGPAAGDLARAAQPDAQPAPDACQQGILDEIARQFSAALAVPLLIQNEIYGTIMLYNRGPRTFSVEEINLAITFARQAALAIENARLRQQVEQAAVREERGRLARDLHDSATQSIYSLTLLAEGWRLAAREDGRAEFAAQFARLGGIAQQALKEMRLLIHHLRLPELERDGLVGALERRLDSVERRSGIDAQVLVEGAIDLPTPDAEQLYRVIQEALNNTLKHAAATAVAVTISGRDGAALDVRVRDNGRGFDPAAVTPGFGMDSMRERAERLGGSLLIDSAPGTGTTVAVSGIIRRRTV